MNTGTKKYKDIEPKYDVKYRFTFFNGKTFEHTYLVFIEHLPDGRLSFINVKHGSVCPPMTQARFNYIMAKNKPVLTPLGQSEMDLNIPKVKSCSEEKKEIPQEQTKAQTFNEVCDDMISALKNLSAEDLSRFNELSREPIEYFINDLKKYDQSKTFVTVGSLFGQLKIAW